MLAVALALLFTASARAGTYEVWSCADANGKPVVADGWAAEGGAQFSPSSNACASGGGLYAWLHGDFDHPVGTNVAWHFTAPPATKIARYRIWRAAVADANRPNETPLYTLNRARNVYDGPWVVEQCPAYGCHALGSTADPFGSANLVTDDNLTDVRDIWLNASCGGAGGSTCTAAAGTAPETAAFHMYRAAIVLQDDADPVFSTPPAGSLTAGGVLAGVQGVSYSATDAGGGVLRAEIEVDRRTVAEELVCARPYTAVVPCKPAASGSLSFDTATLADGPHSVRVLVADATGTNVASFGPFTITTSNAPTTCSPTEATDVAVGFDRKRRTIAYGGKLSVVGQAPPGASVRVFSQVSRAGSPVKLARTPVVADASGRFTYRVPAGPSRALRFAYGSGADALLACSKPLLVAVKARSTLKATPRSIRSGQRVRFSGKLRGGYVPTGGKLVELQAYERGRWRSITTLRTTSRGSFSYRYRFSFRARGTTFPVRVRVRPDASYPFALGTSKRVRVRVR
jgi:hypothetical protein